MSLYALNMWKGSYGPIRDLGKTHYRQDLKPRSLGFTGPNNLGGKYATLAEHYVKHALFKSVI